MYPKISYSGLFPRALAMAASCALFLNAACIRKIANFENEPPQPAQKGTVQRVTNSAADSDPGVPVASHDCCWCMSTFNDSNRVFPIADEKECAKLELGATYHHCKIVHVIEPTCSLLKSFKDVSGVTCQPSPLHYLENKQQFTIDPPEDPATGGCITDFETPGYDRSKE
jgi:hypothetical protein